jgi:nitronate monooxygenase/enoyl-[acyl-carrier protein] reductase II
MILIPQVVDAVGDVPVVASGGIFDGRGLAAVITLGAQGVALGTRFLASVEAPIDVTWKRSITTARSDQVVRVPGWNEVFPLTSSRGYDVAPNSLQTPFTEECGQVRGLGERLQAISDAPGQKWDILRGLPDVRFGSKDGVIGRHSCG